KTPGTLHGVVQLQPGDDSRTVFILFLGTHSYTTPDDAAGNFSTEPMAGGKYRARILTTLSDYQVMDTNFTIKAGKDSVMADTIRMKYTGIPTPKDLKVSFDTLHQTVDLSWAMPDTSLLSGYNVYRSIKGQNFSLVTQTPLPKTQTVYYDTGLTVGTVYEYRVVSRTQAGVESKMIETPGDTALIVSASMVTTLFSWSSVNTIHDTASINDTVKVIVNYSNPTRKIDSVYWYLDTAQLPRRTKIDSSLSGKDSLTYYCPAQAGLRQLIVKAVDAGNTTWRDTFKLWVILDAPKANAGNDTVVGRGDTIHLHGSKSTDRFGRIVKYEWDIGNTGNFIECLTGDTNIFVSDSVLSYLYCCVLRVTDDDNCTGLDTVMIDKKVEGIFTEATSAAAFAVRFGQSSVVFNNKMWVIGGGDCNSDEMYNDVWNSTDGITWTLVTPSADFPRRQCHRSVVFNNKMWVIGGETIQLPPGGSGQVTYPQFNDVWYSTDGVSWTFAGNAGFSARSNHTAVVYNNKIWIIGGDDGSHLLSDVWCSSDGVSWVQVTDSANFPGREYHSSVVFDNKIWIFGGNNLCDVWYSIDGLTWIMAKDSVSSISWTAFASVVFNNKIWVFGANSRGMVGTIWSSKDGISWIEATDSTSFAKRSFHSSVVYDDKIWSIGGLRSDVPVCYPMNDVWYLK
ncbi:MAG: hypothetical protein ABSF80_12150, partial [Chitinispirillaceae bacterium]